MRHSKRAPFFARSLCVALLFFALRAHAHFQVLIPSTDVVSDPKQNAIAVALKFAHPMEGKPVMNMDMR